MQKVTRAILLVVGIVVGAAAIILLGVNLYVQSQGIQTRIQQEVSQRVGTPVRMSQVSITPWGGLKLSGITVPGGATNGAENFLEAKTFRLRVRFSSLFSGPLIVKEIALIDPRVVWAQNADGKWELPGSLGENPPPPKKKTVRAEKPEETKAAESPATTSALTPAPTEEVTIVPSTPRIRRLKVSGGNFRFLDSKRNFVAAFEGLQFRSNFDESGALNGNADVSKISLSDRFFFHRLRSTIHYDSASLDLSQVFARIGDGEISGQFAMEPQTENSPFSLSVRFRNVQADHLITEAGGAKGTLQGRLEGILDASGEIARPDALKGKGEIYLHDGQLRQYSVLAALGEMLQIEELRQLQLEQAEAQYHIDSGKVIVDELLLRSPNTRLTAKGTIGLDGKLHLDSRLAINEKIRNQLFKPIRANFQPSVDPGYFAVDFEISGTVDRPKSNLVDKVVGRDLKDLGNMINMFLGGTKPAEKKKQSESGTPSPTP